MVLKPGTNPQDTCPWSCRSSNFRNLSLAFVRKLYNKKVTLCPAYQLPLRCAAFNDSTECRSSVYGKTPTQKWKQNKNTDLNWTVDSENHYTPVIWLLQMTTDWSLVKFRKKSLSTYLAEEQQPPPLSALPQSSPPPEEQHCPEGAVDAGSPAAFNGNTGNRFY